MGGLGLPILLGLLLLALSVAVYLLAWLVALLASRRPGQFATLEGRAGHVMESVRPLGLIALLGLAGLKLFIHLSRSSDGAEVEFTQEIAPFVTFALTATFAVLLVGWLFFPILLARALRESGGLRALFDRRPDHVPPLP